MVVERKEEITNPFGGGYYYSCAKMEYGCQRAKTSSPLFSEINSGLHEILFLTGVLHKERRGNVKKFVRKKG